MQLQKDLQAIEATGTQLVGISYDSVETLKDFSEAQNIGYQLLSDEGSRTIRAWGLHEREGYSQPATYLIDPGGLVRQKLFREGYRERHGNAELIEAAKQLAE